LVAVGGTMVGPCGEHDAVADRFAVRGGASNSGPDSFVAVPDRSVVLRVCLITVSDSVDTVVDQTVGPHDRLPARSVRLVGAPELLVAGDGTSIAVADTSVGLP